MRRACLLVASLALVSSQVLTGAPGRPTLPKKARQALDGLSGERMRAHLKFLSSDLLEGRGTGQRGGELAAAYIAAQFELMGLTPGAADGTYFQKVPLVGIKTEEGTTLQLAGPSGSVPLK